MSELVTQICTQFHFSPQVIFIWPFLEMCRFRSWGNEEKRGASVRGNDNLLSACHKFCILARASPLSSGVPSLLWKRNVDLPKEYTPWQSPEKDKQRVTRNRKPVVSAHIIRRCWATQPYAAPGSTNGGWHSRQMWQGGRVKGSSPQQTCPFQWWFLSHQSHLQLQEIISKKI